MKLRLLILATILGSLSANAQCSVPPPPGYYPIYSVDLDNDGFAAFDIAYVIETQYKPSLEQYYHVSTSSYNFEFYNGNHQLSSQAYTNIMNDEWGNLKYVYSGSGATFDPQPPCFWILPDTVDVRLVPVPFDGDMDSDGITNRFEDTNNNLNLMDDDDDHDGIINVLDNSATLDVAVPEKPDVKIYPNPVTNGLITFESGKTIDAVRIYDFTGKLLLEKTGNSNLVNVSQLAPGTYLLKLEVNDETIFKKIIVR
jgi:hypothetical protein